MIILDNFGLKNCLKKSFPGDVRTQVLQVPVGGSHGDQDGLGCPETQKTEFDFVPHVRRTKQNSV